MSQQPCSTCPDFACHFVGDPDLVAVPGCPFYPEQSQAAPSPAEVAALVKAARALGRCDDTTCSFQLAANLVAALEPFET